MKTHISNTKARELELKYEGRNIYNNHQTTLHSGAIKPIVETRRKSEVKIVNNNKIELNQQPMKQANQLLRNIVENKYKSTIDNKAPDCYENGKKILKDKIKKNPKENYIQQEHERELRSQANRVKNCKSINQRKKDNCDPIVNPTYLMRERSDVKEVTIEGYKNTILKKNRPVSAIPNNSHSKEYDSKITMQSHDNRPMMMTYASIQNYNNKSITKPKSAGQTRSQFNNTTTNTGTDLPKCTFKDLLNHIIDNKMYKESDIKVLYVRLCHKYGEEEVDEIWEPLMDELER